MDSPENAPPTGPPELPVVKRDRRAAWWCWPLIFFSLIPFSWFASSGPGKEGDALVSGRDQSDLALLKMQGQVVIATFRLNPASANEALDDLGEMITDDHSVAALALLECFVQPDSTRAASLLKRFSGSVPGDLAEVTNAAVHDGVDEAGREQLRGHLGWFADLARGPGLSAPPMDQSIRTRAFVVLGTMGLILTGGLLGILAGGVLLIVYVRRINGGAPLNAFDSTRKPREVMLECFSLYLGIMTIGALLGAYVAEPVSVISYGAAVVVPLLWPLLRGIAWKDFRAAVGLHRGKGWLREIGAGFVGYLAVLTIASIGISLTLAITMIAGAFEAQGVGDGATPVGPESHPIVGWIYGGTTWTRLACLALAAGFAPFFEELFFRGALHRYFRGRFRFFGSALLTGVIFAALHPQGVYAIPALTGMGIGFSLLREWRDSLIAPMVAHAINNGVLVGMLWWIL